MNKNLLELNRQLEYKETIVQSLTEKIIRIKKKINEPQIDEQTFQLLKTISSPKKMNKSRLALRKSVVFNQNLESSIMENSITSFESSQKFSINQSTLFNYYLFFIFF